MNYELRILNRGFLMLNQWQGKKAIATIISAFTLLVSTGGLVSCGSNTPQENQADEQIDQNNNQRINQNNNQRNQSHNEQNEERDDDNNRDNNDRGDNEQDDNN